MRLVDLETLNKLRFPDNPVGIQKLRRWCRDEELPARKVGREWFVDLDAFDRPTRDSERFSDRVMLHLQDHAA